MNNVLFVAYEFPPCKNVGASLRSQYFVRYLGEFGWHPKVVCLGPAAGEEQYQDLHRVRSITPWHRPYELTPYGWTAPLIRNVRQLLNKHEFKLIYVSCPPFVHAGALNRLRHSFALPLVLDLRDAWSLDPYVEGSRLKKFMYKRVFPRWEKKVFSDTNRVLFNTPSALDSYLKLYPHLAHRFSLLPNGYDEQDFENILISNSPPTAPLTIVHVGRFGIGNRDPSVIFDALRILKRKAVKLVLKIIGSPIGNLDIEAETKDLFGMVEIIPTIPHELALKELCSSDVALLYQETSQSRVTAVAGKTHEYLRSGKPIIAIAPSGDNLDLIERMAGFSITIHQPANASVIAEELLRLVGLKARGELPVYSSAKPEYIEQYSRRALTRTLANQFEKALERP